MTNDAIEWDDWHGLNLWAMREYSLRLRAERAQQLGLTAWDNAIFRVLWYEGDCSSSEENLARRAFGDYGKNWPEKARAAIHNSFESGFIHRIDSEFIASMSAELTTQGYLMPNGLLGTRNPEEFVADVGLISFTKAGAAICLQTWRTDSNRDFAFEGIAGTRDCFAYGVTLEDCDAAIVPLGEGTELHRYSTESIGRWCNRWWVRHESGYRVRFALPADPDDAELFDWVFN